MGLAIFFPKMSGADPCTGSKREGKFRSGLIFPEGAIPIVPVQAGPKSERISPNKFDATYNDAKVNFFAHNFFVFFSDLSKQIT